MDSWSETKSLFIVTIIIVIFYMLGRLIAASW